eukprot:TRINITY_DN3470_c0_g1_i3.p1 TRINITY_DN3470_c0_g1~~TRINITY_DN3470_c0_g1_i3.p1  ORF type:complete len:357 (-),score=47.42 TRINITY_DN3470_c0_g1_i3:18-1088(-)
MTKVSSLTMISSPQKGGRCLDAGMLCWRCVACGSGCHPAKGSWCRVSRYPRASMDQAVLLDLILVFSIVSLILSLFVFITYLTFHSTKFPSRLVIYFTLCISVITTCMNFVLVFGADISTWDPRVCTVQGSLLTFFSSASVFWWFTMMLQVYLSFVKDFKRLKRYEPFIHIVCWGLAAAIAIPPIFFKSYTHLHLWCGLGSLDGSVLQLVAVDVGLAGVCVVGAGMWCRVVYCMFRGNKMSYSLKSRSHDYMFPVRVLRQACFVFCFLVVFGFSLFHKIYMHVAQISFDASEPGWLIVCHVVVATTQGIINFLIFGCKRQNFVMWSHLIARGYRRLGSACGYNREVPLMDGYSLNI